MADDVYILLFRGVGGATQLPTAPLREKLTAAGFDRVTTYISSGNAVLRTSQPKDLMLQKVAEICRREFCFGKEIYALTLPEWDRLVADNPFKGAFTEGRFLHAAVLERPPLPAAIDVLRALAIEGEGVEVVGKVAYLNTPGGLSKSRLGAKFDKGLGVANTARNWNTVLRLRELARAAAAA